MEISEYVGKRIRELREGYGEGLSQEALAKSLGLASNTISRWETATYKPSIEDLDALSRFFGVSILEFFPSEDVVTDDKVAALLRTAKQLKDADLNELQKYAEFRRARNLYAHGVKPRAGRKKKV